MSKTLKACAAATALALLSSTAGAVQLLCENPAVNHMYVDDAYVSACIDAGMGNINGNPITDDFLKANPSLDYVGIGSGVGGQTGTTGTFSFSDSLWDDWSSIAIGFKFGTGSTRGVANGDQWFVYLLNPDVSSGAWTFVNMYKQGGGLSHVTLYGVTERTEVPEPATLGLLGLGLLGLGLGRRKAKA